MLDISLRTFENREVQKRNALVFFGYASKNVCFSYVFNVLDIFLWQKNTYIKTLCLPSKDVSFLKGAYRAHIRTHYFNH